MLNKTENRKNVHSQSNCFMSSYWPLGGVKYGLGCTVPGLAPVRAIRHSARPIVIVITGTCR